MLSMPVFQDSVFRQLKYGLLSNRAVIILGSMGKIGMETYIKFFFKSSYTDQLSWTLRKYNSAFMGLHADNVAYGSRQKTYTSIMKA